MKAKVIKKNVEGFKQSFIEYMDRYDRSSAGFILKCWVASSYNQKPLQFALKCVLRDVKKKFGIKWYIVDVSNSGEKTMEYFYLKINIHIKCENGDFIDDIFDLMVEKIQDSVGSNLLKNYTPKKYK